MAINEINGVAVGEYGEAITVTIRDEDGNAENLSTYDGTKTVTVRSPDKLKYVNWTASFTGDGSNGQIQFTPQSGDIDRAGTWEGQIKLTATGIVAKSDIFKMFVEEAIA